MAHTICRSPRAGWSGWRQHRTRSSVERHDMPITMSPRSDPTTTGSQPPGIVSTSSEGTMGARRLGIACHLHSTGGVKETYSRACARIPVASVIPVSNSPQAESRVLTLNSRTTKFTGVQNTANSRCVTLGGCPVRSVPVPNRISQPLQARGVLCTNEVGDQGEDGKRRFCRDTPPTLASPPGVTSRPVQPSATPHMGQTGTHPRPSRAPWAGTIGTFQPTVHPG